MIFSYNNKKLSALLRGITSKRSGDFHCLSSFHSFRRKSRLESHKKLVIKRENKDFCNVIVASEDIKILKLSQYQKSDKTPFIIYEDLEWLIEKVYGCKNNPESSYTTKISEQYFHLET